MNRTWLQLLSWLQKFADPGIDRRLLTDQGEQVIDEVRHHWVVYLTPLLEALGAMLLFFVFLVSAVSVAWMPLLLGCAVLGHAGWRALKRHMDRFVITNMRVFRLRGVFSQRVGTMPLARILDISVERPFIGRVLGFGHFVFESAAQEQGLREIRFVGHINERDLTIQRVIQQAGLRGGAKPTG